MQRITLVRQSVLRNQFYILGVRFCFVFITPIPVIKQRVNSFGHLFYILESQNSDQSKHVIEGLIPMPSCLQ